MNKKIIAMLLTVIVCVSSLSFANSVIAEERTNFVEMIDVYQSSSGDSFISYDSYVNNTYYHSMWINFSLYNSKGDLILDSFTKIPAQSTSSHSSQYSPGHSLSNLEKWGEGYFFMECSVRQGVIDDPKGNYGKSIYRGKRMCLYQDLSNPSKGVWKKVEWTSEIDKMWGSIICERNGYHLVSSRVITKQPTLFSTGSGYWVCNNCGNHFPMIIPKLKATIKLNKSKLKLRRKMSYKLKIIKMTSGDSVSKWKSTNKKVATVNKKGKIKAKKKGKCKIKLYMKSGVIATCKITVKK